MFLLSVNMIEGVIDSLVGGESQWKGIPLEVNLVSSKDISKLYSYFIEEYDGHIIEHDSKVSDKTDAELEYNERVE